MASFHILLLRYIVDEVMLSIQTIPVKFRAPQYNLLGYLFALQGNYNYAFRSFVLNFDGVCGIKRLIIVSLN